MSKTAVIVFAQIIFLTTLSGTGNAQEQDIYKYEIFGGFSFADLANSRIGWNFIAVRNITRNLGIAVDISRTNYREEQAVIYSMDLNVSNRRNIFLAGLQLSERESGKWTHYAQFMLGTDRSYYSGDLYWERSYVSHFQSGRVNSFAMSMGGGIDCQIKGPLAFRIIHANIILLRPAGFGVWDVRGKVSSGLVFRHSKTGY
jgi:hypothetical protein